MYYNYPHTLRICCYQINMKYLNIHPCMHTHIHAHTHTLKFTFTFAPDFVTENNFKMFICNRDIQDRFRSIFTAETKQQITNASGISMLSDTIFLRAQYDTLRRLRSYWVLRYIIHKERLGELKYETKFNQCYVILLYYNLKF